MCWCHKIFASNLVILLFRRGGSITADFFTVRPNDQLEKFGPPSGTCRRHQPVGTTFNLNRDWIFCTYIDSALFSWSWSEGEKKSFSFSWPYLRTPMHHFQSEICLKRLLEMHVMSSLEGRAVRPAIPCEQFMINGWAFEQMTKPSSSSCCSKTHFVEWQIFSAMAISSWQQTRERKMDSRARGPSPSDHQMVESHQNWFIVYFSSFHELGLAKNAIC